MHEYGNWEMDGTPISTTCPALAGFPYCHICHIILCSRRVKNGGIITVVQAFGIAVHINDRGNKSMAMKCRGIAEVVQFIGLRRRHRMRCRLLFCIGIGSRSELLFAIALKRIGMLVNADGTNGIIQHSSKLGKEKDKQGGYG